MDEMQNDGLQEQIIDSETGLDDEERLFASAFNEVTGDDEPSEDAETGEGDPPDPELQEKSVHPERPSKEDEDLQHKYDSMMGRLKSSQDENRTLREQLARMQARMAEQNVTEKERPASSVDGLEEIPGELHEFFLEQSLEGDRLRRVLDEYGPEQAAFAAENLRERRELRGVRDSFTQDYEQERIDRHRNAVANACPDYADAILGNDKAKTDELFSGVRAWIGTLPYEEGVRMMQYAQEGTTAQTIELLNRYHAYRKGGAQERVRNLAASNMAVPSHKGVPPKRQATSFDDAFEEFASRQ